MLIVNNFFFRTIGLFILFALPLFSHSANIDSLLKAITNKPDTNNISTYFSLGIEFKNNNPDTSTYFYKKAIVIANTLLKSTSSKELRDYIFFRKIDILRQIGWNFYVKGENDRAMRIYNNSLAALNAKLQHVSVGYKEILLKTKAVIFLNKGLLLKESGDYNQASEVYNKAIDIGKKLNNQQLVSGALTNLGMIFLAHGNYNEALKHLFEALKMDRVLKSKKHEANNLVNIGVIYDHLQEYEKAVEYYTQAYQIGLESSNQRIASTALSNMAASAYELNQLQRALIYSKKALEMKKQINDRMGTVNILANLGSIYSDLGDSLLRNDIKNQQYQEFYKKALESYLSAKEIYKGANNLEGELIQLVNLGSLYITLDKYSLAENSLKEAFSIAQYLDALEHTQEIYAELSRLYEVWGKHSLALSCYKKEIQLRDSIKSEENIKQQTQVEMNYEFEKKQAIARAEQDKKDALAQQDKQRQKVILISVIVGFLVVIGFSFLLYKRFKLTTLQKQIIENQKNEVDGAYHKLHERNKEIMDSIRYAARIQRSLITNVKYIAKHINR